MSNSLVDNVRPSIPAELERSILVEAGHRCAIPTCRQIEIEIHHIIPWERCKNHEYDNLIALCRNCHSRSDKGQIDRKSLRMYKSNLRFLTDKFSNFEVDTLFELTKKERLSILEPMKLLVKRLIDADYIVYEDTPSWAAVGGNRGQMKLNPDYISITQKGKDFALGASSYYYSSDVT
jgi:hypothetical protein